MSFVDLCKKITTGVPQVFTICTYVRPMYVHSFRKLVFLGKLDNAIWQLHHEDGKFCLIFLLGIFFKNTFFPKDDLFFKKESLVLIPRKIKTTFVIYNFLLTFSFQQIFEILLAFIALGNAEIMEFDICPKNKPYKFKNGQYCCSEPIKKEFDQCDGIEEKCHYSSGCDDCKFLYWS